MCLHTKIAIDHVDQLMKNSAAKVTRPCAYKLTAKKKDTNFDLPVKMADQTAVDKIEHLASNLKESVGLQYNRLMGFRKSEEDDPYHPDNLRHIEDMKKKARAKETEIRENAAQRMRRSSWSIETQ